MKSKCPACRGAFAQARAGLRCGGLLSSGQLFCPLCATQLREIRSPLFRVFMVLAGIHVVFVASGLILLAFPATKPMFHWIRGGSAAVLIALLAVLLLRYAREGIRYIEGGVDPRIRSTASPSADCHSS